MLTRSAVGDLTIPGRYLTAERQRSLVFIAHTTMMQDNVRNSQSLGTTQVSADDASEDAFATLPITLPEGSEILGFNMIANDETPDSNITIRLYQQKFGAAPVSLGTTATGFAFDGGVTTESRSFAAGSGPVIEADTSSFLEIKFDGLISSTALGFQHAKLDYLTSSP